MESLLVVGAGLAGLGAVRAARELGFDGSITVVGAEAERPYDRPPLSKDYLSGAATRADIGLEGESESLEAVWRLGSAAVAFDAPARTVTLADGSTHTADAVVLATGSRARTLPELEAANVVTLRTLADADRLRRALEPGARIVIVGAGLIGSEIASTAVGFGCAVTIITKDAHPLARLYGEEIADHLADWHRSHGVEVVRNAEIEAVERSGVDGAGSASALVLADGRRLPTDVVVVAVGGEPDIGWLIGSGLEIGDGVICTEHGATSVPGVVAVGDCAAWWDLQVQRHHRAQHWNDALERPAFALAALLGTEPARQRPFLPYFWSDQYGRKIQMAGYGSLADTVTITDGDPTDPAAGFVAEYTRAGDTVAVLTVSRPRDFMKWRRTLTASLGHLPAIPTSASLVAAPAVAAPAPLDQSEPHLDHSPQQESA